MSWKTSSPAISLFHKTCYATSKVLVPGDFVGQLTVRSSERRACKRFDLRAGAARPSWRCGGGHQEARQVTPLVPEIDLVMEADVEFIILAEDLLELPTHMPDNVQSLPTGGLWRRRSKVRVKERQKVVIVGWCDHIGAALTSTVVQVRGVWIYSSMHTDDRTKFLESDMCSRQEALSNLTVHHWEGSLGARFSGRSAHQNVEQNPDSLRHPCVKSRRCGTTLCPGWRMYQRCTRRELWQ